MKQTPVVLAPLCPDDREQFILDNQWAFLYGARQEFGMRDNHLEEDGQVISRRSIQRSLDAAGSAAYRILLDGRKVGGVVLHIDCQTHHNHLDLLFVSPEAHSKGVGFATAKGSALPPGRRWRRCIRKRWSGKRLPPTLKRGIFISTSTNADFTRWSFSGSSTP